MKKKIAIIYAIVNATFLLMSVIIVKSYTESIFPLKEPFAMPLNAYLHLLLPFCHIIFFVVLLILNVNYYTKKDELNISNFIFYIVITAIALILNLGVAMMFYFSF